MATVWITYCWDDNQDRDVDFVAQELQHAGLTVTLDRWNLTAGQRLWDQIANFITSPTKCDVWLFYATQRSLASEPCREELAYALDRALSSRGETFPLIALFPSSIDHNLIPPSIRVRLFISLTDPDWRERIIAAAERRPAAITADSLQPFVAQSIGPAPAPYIHILEFRPRAGVWNPFIVGVPVADKDRVGMMVRSGPIRRIPPRPVVEISRTGLSDDGLWYVYIGHDAATPTLSYYAFLREMPSRILFGQEGAHGKVWFADGLRVTDVGPLSPGSPDRVLITRES